MAVEGIGSGSNGVAFLVSAGLVYEAIAAACSSPQTTELNAGSRAPTLMKWVNLGVGQAILFVIIAAAIDSKHRLAILAGGGTAAVLMYAQYAHAKSAGLKNGGPPTETYGSGAWGRG
jgi:uncharacterized membrane protein YdcZ (DUF606 family)